MSNVCRTVVYTLGTPFVTFWTIRFLSTMFYEDMTHCSFSFHIKSTMVEHSRSSLELDLLCSTTVDLSLTYCVQLELDLLCSTTVDFSSRIETVVGLLCAYSFLAFHHRSDSLCVIFAFIRTSSSERISDRHALQCVTPFA